MAVGRARQAWPSPKQGYGRGVRPCNGAGRVGGAGPSPAAESGKGEVPPPLHEGGGSGSTREGETGLGLPKRGGIQGEQPQSLTARGEWGRARSNGWGEAGKQGQA